MKPCRALSAVLCLVCIHAANTEVIKAGSNQEFRQVGYFNSPAVTTVVCRSDGCPCSGSTRRARRMARRGWGGTCCVPQVQSPDCAAGGATHGVNAANGPAGAKETKVSADVRVIAQANNRFAFDLFQNLDEKGRNRFFAPANLWTGLAMTSGGAAGETRQQMADVLHYDATDSRTQTGFRGFTAILNAPAKSYRLNMANRLWVQNGFRIAQPFVQANREILGADPGSVDFADSETTRSTINQWVGEQTAGKIADLISPGVLQEKTRFVLTNAVYFKGTWKYQFAKPQTREAPFHISADREIKAPTMQLTGALRYAKINDVQLLELPYAGDQLSMLIFLPNQIDGLPALENKLAAGDVQEWVAKLHHEDEVEVYLPKFTFTSQIRLKEVLSALGMPLAFSEEADFSGICTEKAQQLSNVIHQAFVDVNEEGTEAAAATGVIFSDAPGPVPQTVVFRADHPFLFLIHDNRTGAILFLGRVVNPALRE
jgi:serpin B